MTVLSNSSKQLRMQLASAQYKCWKCNLIQLNPNTEEVEGGETSLAHLTKQWGKCVSSLRDRGMKCSCTLLLYLTHILLSVSRHHSLRPSFPENTTLNLQIHILTPCTPERKKLFSSGSRSGTNFPGGNTPTLPCFQLPP